jgi:hypothetical protein
MSSTFTRLMLSGCRYLFDHIFECWISTSPWGISYSISLTYSPLSLQLSATFLLYESVTSLHLRCAFVIREIYRTTRHLRPLMHTSTWTPPIRHLGRLKLAHQ